MCGITGILSFNQSALKFKEKVVNAINKLHNRGPENKGLYFNEHIILAHSRLSIIDTSINASQPMSDNSGRYTIIFNGEFFNYLQYRNQLINEGISFKTNSDTEVLLYLYIKEKEKCLNKINGFFVFAVWDNIDKTLFIARDRFGIKPLLYYLDDEKLIFASEMKAILEYNIKKDIDYTSLFIYLQLTYIESPHSIFANVKKLEAGSYILINKDKTIINKKYFDIENIYNSRKQSSTQNYSKDDFLNIIYDAVKLRLIADVPVGAFLSGGVDSSIIVAVASHLKPNLKTFTIGYENNKYFDETEYAKIVAQKFNTDHQTFIINDNELYEYIFKVLDYIDEPFADSSTIPFFILANKTKQKITVALSGDGADEIFSGYNKHSAEFIARKCSKIKFIFSLITPIIKILPQNRYNKYFDIIRQLSKLSSGITLSPKDRYWFWASFNDFDIIHSILNISLDYNLFLTRKNNAISLINHYDFHSTLFNDLKLVLENDMLRKVDLMSMANSLEVRNPFLDYRIFEYISNINTNNLIKYNNRKIILKQSFSDIIPKEILTRKKHGFEIPLISFFKNQMSEYINEILSENFIKEQNIFDYNKINTLKIKIANNNNSDIQSLLWTIIVFQHWWKKYIIN